MYLINIHQMELSLKLINYLFFITFIGFTVSHGTIILCASFYINKNKYPYYNISK
ncbi:hypothetical protein NT01EI_1126 [Edwardsiella ictaluri 93-146]|uniref:Uncharacterized protein n=1 Tax=Edwardsiella ictaluri (strain 93-146) TaxID=634503 RepID=C5BD19_EDWI9|nr:hypothetical protein NT01EI_1126 [Edwardsiella ictaluri 93-146]